MPKLLRRYNSNLGERWLPLAPAEPTPEPEPPDFDAIAAEIRAQAETVATTIIEEAQGTAEQIKQQAYAEGFAEGRTTGEQACDERMASIETLINEINHDREDFYDRAEAELVRLATAIAEKVLAQQLSLKPEVVIDITRTQMKRIREREKLRIRLHPDDVALVQDARSALLAEVDGVRDLQLFEDRRVTRGGVILETEHGSFDARITSQMDVIRQALNGVQEDVDAVTAD